MIDFLQVVGRELCERLLRQMFRQQESIVIREDYESPSDKCS
jgi:hypothetical protein